MAFAQERQPAPFAAPRAFALGETARLSSGPQLPVRSDGPFVLKPAMPASLTEGDVAPVASVIDDSALRYYASQNNVARVAAEIRRLKAKYPNWDPPQDLFSSSRQSEEEQPLWELFGQGRFDEIRERIADIQADRPDWTPSTELTTKLELGSARAAIAAASDQGDWGSVLAMASETPALLVSGEIDVLWRVAEALAKTGDLDRAADAYRYVIANCRNADARLATVQKASLTLDRSALEDLIALGGRRRDGANEFAAVQLDLLRRKIGEATADASKPAPTPAEIEQIKAVSQAQRSSSDASLVGWYSYSRKDFSAAETWFRTALGYGRDAKSAEGLTLTLRDGGKPRDAEAAAYEFRDASALNQKIFVELIASALTATPPQPVGSDRLAAFVGAVEASKSSLGAQSYGWSLYAAAQFSTARDWFAKSVAWEATEPGVVGLVVASQRMRDLATVRALIVRHRDQFPVLATLENLGRAPAATPRTGGGQSAKRGWSGGPRAADLRANEALTLFHAKKYKEAIAKLDDRDRIGRRDPGLEVVRGWALFHSGDWQEAKKVFANVNPTLPQKGHEGLRVIRERELPKQFR